MKNLAVANALALNPYALKTVAKQQNSLQRVREYAAALPGVERCVLLVPQNGGVGADALKNLGFETRSLSGEGAAELLEALKEQLAEQTYDNLFYFFADCPLLDAGLSARMLENHGRYYADYTFADGFPYGLSPEILRPEVLGPLLELARGSQAAAGSDPIRATDRGALFELIKKDINAFDIETELAPVDLRLLRAELSADSRRNFLLVERVLEAGAADAEAICRLLEEKPEILRTLPSFFAVQIVAGCPQLCSYCPYPQQEIENTGKLGQMELDAFSRILDQIEDFCAEATLSVSLWGEPSYHSDFVGLATAALGRGFPLVVETSGIGWKEQTVSRLAELRRPGAGGPALDWIVSLDSRDPGEYAKLRGEGFEEANKTVEKLHALFPGRVYPQAVRMQDNEEGLEEFYRYWKNRTGKVIIQKYDSFCGILPDRRVTDLSPLKRSPCWHLKRDVNVLLDGTVALCREDLRRQHVLGNLLEQDLESIWAAGEPFYRSHLEERYPQLCKACDEYYTFNF